VANPEHVEILKQGVEVWNKWRKDNPKEYPDLSQSDFQNIQLWFVDFSRANLSHSDFTNASLMGSIFSSAYLESTLFIAADLRSANLGGITYSRDSAGAYVNHGAILRDTVFTNSRMGLTTLGSLNLGRAIGLESVIHVTPSVIDIETIYKSKGKIPESFLRGCGVPEDFIKLIPSLVAAEPFQLYKCFISHSTKDHLFCDRLYADLQSKGVRCWYFPEDARWGRSVWGEIDKPIKTYDKLILVCSKQSLNSPVVLRELERALQREDAEGKHILFPIRIDNYLFDKWEHPRKTDVISKVVGDFRNWQDPAIYREKLDRLLRNLKASEE